MDEKQEGDPFCPRCGERMRRGLFGEIYCPAEFSAGTGDRRDIELEPPEHDEEFNNE